MSRKFGDIGVTWGVTYWGDYTRSLVYTPQVWRRQRRHATALKRRQLRAAGWALLPVPHWEWRALGSEAAKQEYLQGGLRAALVSRDVT